VGTSEGQDTSLLVSEVPLIKNTLILFNSRAFEYEVVDVQCKTLLLTNKVPGPAKPPVTSGAAF